MGGDSPADDKDWERALDRAKRKVRSELSLDDWRKYEFGGARAAEFDALCNTQDEPANGIAREACGTLSVEDFWEKYERPALPCLISGVPEAEGWRAATWTWQSLFGKYGSTQFKVGKDDGGSAVRVKMAHFEPYMEQQRDDSPMYLFDNKFSGAKRELLEDFRVPSYFPDDYMSLTPDDRPPYRWMGIGPRRSGTIMHVDPLWTSAWNTLIIGRKLWLLLPPDTPRKVAKGKDVMKKDDDDEAVNHFLDLLPRKRASDASFNPILAIQHPGETIFVPGNWWHCVVNLDDTVAVTQNYCGRNNFEKVWRSAREERPCWAHKWLRAMEQHRPELAAEARRMNTEDNFDMMKLRSQNRERKRKQLERQDQRALRRAKARSLDLGAPLDELVWWAERRAKQEAIDSDSTADTTSSEDSSSTSSTSAESGA